MADYVFNKVAGEVNIMPIRAISIYFNTDYYIFYYLEDKSNFGITPLTETNHYGKPITLGHSINGTFYIPHNAYPTNNMITILKAMQNSFHDLRISLGNASVQSLAAIPNEPVSANATDDMNIDFDGDTGLSYEIQYDNQTHRPYVMLRIAGMTIDETDTYFS
jgi:hypothetical protein